MATATRNDDPRITVIQKELFDERKSKRQRYSDLVVGEPGLWALIKFEIVITLCAAMPGALGLALRSWLYRLLLGRSGRGVTKPSRPGFERSRPISRSSSLTATSCRRS